MTEWDDLPFLDYDPDARQQATEAERVRVKDGFARLLDALQGPSLARHEADKQKWRDAMRKLNIKLGVRDGHFIPEGCSIPVSPELVERLQKSRTL